ncbi:MAG: ELWxxDGT repeat protein [Cyanobacteria bacterium P01_E01_bin.35]
MKNKTAQIVLVKDINPDPNNDGQVHNSDPYRFIEFNDQLYFTADDGEHGRELWVSDGTTAGTQLVADINPGSSSSNPHLSSTYNPSSSYSIEFQDQLYFSADDGEHGNELWVSDGTTAGTQLVADINLGIVKYNGTDSTRYNYGSLAQSFIEFQDQLYFTAEDFELGDEPWVSDGTTAGTQLLKDLHPAITRYGYGQGSFVSDFIEFQDQLYFSAYTPQKGSPLWVSDGTTAGTQLFQDLNPEPKIPNFRAPSNFTEFEDKLFFTAYYNGEKELGFTDGTASGTQLLADITPDSSGNSYLLTELEGKLFFTTYDDSGKNGDGLWVSDGTKTGTQLLLEIDPAFTPGSYRAPVIAPGYTSFTEHDDRLFFTVDDGENGNEFWVSDGTTAGTQLLADINLGSSSYISNFTEFDGRLFFTAENDEKVKELWVSDGTAVGTQSLLDISYNAVSDRGLTVAAVGDELFFSAGNDETGRELYKLTFDEVGADITDIIGTKFDDRLVGDDGADDIQGLKGQDTLGGKADHDLLDGGADDDVIFGADGQDTLIGGHGNDLMRGQSGKDVLDGGVGDDTLFGGNQFDRLNGGNGDDFLDGGQGITVYNGGAGSDLFFIHDDAQTDWIQDFELGIDNIRLAGDLTWEQLEITGHGNSLINFQGEQIAIVIGVPAHDLNASSFQQA